MTGTPLDLAAMERIGHGVQLELLTGVGASQPFPPSELTMSAAAWDQLATLRTRGVFARVDSGSAQMVELRELGLVSASGGMTPEAESLLAVRSQAKTLFGATANTAGHHTTFNSWYAGGDALVAAQRIDDAGSPVVSLHRTTRSASLGLLTSWLRMGPAWSLDHGDEVDEHDADLIQRRVDAAPGQEPAVPDDASWVTRRAWAAGGWTRCAVVSPALAKKAEQIRTGDVGWFRPEPTSVGRVRLVPLNSMRLMYNILELLQDTVRLTR
jgi:hypothetical protein